MGDCRLQLQLRIDVFPAAITIAVRNAVTNCNSSTSSLNWRLSTHASRVNTYALDVSGIIQASRRLHADCKMQLRRGLLL